MRDGTRSHARIVKAQRCSDRNRNCRNGNWPQIWMHFSARNIDTEPWLTNRERPASARPMKRTLQQGGHFVRLSAGGKPGHVGFQRPQFRNATGSECGGARYIRCRALRSRPPSRRERARLQPRSFPVSLIEDDDLARGGIKCLDHDRFILDGQELLYEPQKSPEELLRSWLSL